MPRDLKYVDFTAHNRSSDRPACDVDFFQHETKLSTKRVEIRAAFGSQVNLAANFGKLLFKPVMKGMCGLLAYPFLLMPNTVSRDQLREELLKLGSDIELSPNPNHLSRTNRVVPTDKLLDALQRAGADRLVIVSYASKMPFNVYVIDWWPTGGPDQDYFVAG